MSNERHETVADIVKEIRGNAEHNHALVEVSKYLTEIADRIEAALKRERERGYVGRGSGDVLAVDSNAGDLHDDETYQKGGEGMKRMSAIAMVRLCETADDWISMICNQCKIRRPSKASYWFNFCEAVFDSLKSRPIRNCDVFSKAEVLEALDSRSFSKEDTIEWLYAVKGEAALAKPQRNCDVGTPEEQSARFDAHCRKHMGCLTCPLREKDGGVPKHCELAWSQMPYEGEVKE